MEVEEPSPVSEFRFDESSPGEELSARQPVSAEMGRQTIIVTTSGNHNVPVTAPSFTLAAMGNQKLELIGEEFVSKLKSEPEGGEDQGTVVMSLSGAETATVMSGANQGDLVYCNLNDLDLSGPSYFIYFNSKKS